jgi:hypothetical protein
LYFDLASSLKRIIFHSRACCSIRADTKNKTDIHFFKLVDSDYRNFSLASTLKLACMLVDVSQSYDPPSGMIVVLDMEQVRNHLQMFNSDKLFLGWFDAPHVS